MNRVFLAGFVGVAMLLAQPPGPGPDDDQPQDDPPSRVARLSYISGDVAFQPATVDEWGSATLNYPLTTGDHLFVYSGSRAELQIDGSTVRLNSNSNFGFLNLNDNIVQISLSEGSIDIRLRQLDRADSFEIDTPNGAVTLLRAGEYRIDTDPNRNITLVTVRTGQAEMFDDGNSMLITAHQTVRFSDRGAEVSREYPADDFDQFVISRNDAEDALPGRDDVPESMIGSEDLYAYGTWDQDPEYGRVWVPPVERDWTPYSTGRWAFVEPWGWTWIDEAPWGFAPFHYGRWVMTPRGVWVWVPGSRVYRPVYSPALVSFIGGGTFGVSVGWFPLGPREPWIPSWGSRRYIDRVNIMHVRDTNGFRGGNYRYANRDHVTLVSQQDFGSRPVRGAAIRHSPGQIRDAQVLGSGPRVIPGRNSVMIGGPRSAPPVRGRPVVARSPVPRPTVSFQAREQMLTQNNGEPLRPRQVEQLRSQQPSSVMRPVPVRALRDNGNAQRGRQPQQGNREGSGGRPPQREAQPSQQQPQRPRFEAPPQAPAAAPLERRAPQQSQQNAPAPSAPLRSSPPPSAAPAPAPAAQPAPQSAPARGLEGGPRR